MFRYVTCNVLVVMLISLCFGMQSTASVKNGEEVTAHDVPVLMGEVTEISIDGKVGNGNEETPGEWYAGDAPTNPVPNAPVLLFVPGLNNVAQIFWEDNDMYETARDAGYQTAFVQLHDAGGASADMWDNGELLAEKIQEISEHFDQQAITIIAYSKGGVDTQTALTYYDAADDVDQVITLSSPHHGSELADLAYSSWAGWLADLIGAKGDGTYAMQTGNMAAFRNDIDSEPLAYENDYYTLGGTDWGTPLSSTWLGGSYLSQYGENDGVVTAASSSLPDGEELAIGDWNHTTIRTGDTFSAFESYLLGTGDAGEVSASNENVKEEGSPALTQWIHGGPLMKNQQSKTSIAIEENVDHVQFHLLSSEPIDHVNLINADGDNIFPEIETLQNEEGIFTGAYSQIISIDQPHAGNWELNMTSTVDNAYLLIADYDTAFDALKKGTAELINHKEFTYDLRIDSTEVQPQSIHATYHMTQASDPSNEQIFHIKEQSNLSKRFSVTESGEVYNITIDIEGVTKAGEDFKRTIVDSIYVD